MTCAWQLYLFSIINLVGFPLLFLDWCKMFALKQTCNPAEKMTSFLLSFCLAYVGVFYFVLTYLNKGDHPKLKRLAKFAGNAAVATLTAVMMTGSKKFGGYEPGWMHLGDMVLFFVIYILLVSALSDDTPAAPRTNCRGGWGVNPKSLVFLIMILAIIKLFAFTDFVSYEFFAEGEATDVANLFWKMTAVMMFELILAIVFVHEYGSEKEQEATIWIVMVMSIIAFILLPKDAYKAEWQSKSLISVIVMIIIGVLAIIGGRKGWGKDGSSGYESVPAASVDV